jgi:DNA invertase Pin-like site-specific DNA recombinase
VTRTGRRIVLTRYPHIASKASVGVLVRQHLAGGSIQNLLARLLKRLETGDVLMVTRLDRLARSTRDLLNILYTLGERGVGFKSLADS